MGIDAGPNVGVGSGIILLPVDEGGSALAAVPLVADLATAQGSKVLVMGLGPPEERSAAGFVPRIVSTLRAMGVDACARMGRAPTAGSHQTIARVAAELEAGLIVVGTAGPSMQVGMVMWSVNRECSPGCDLLVLRGGAERGLRDCRLLLAVDRSPGSLAAASAALRLATARQSVVRLFHVREALTPDAFTHHLESFGQAQQLVQKAADRFREAGVTAETVVVTTPDHVGGRLMAAAEGFDASLVVAGAGGHYRWEEWLGSVVHDIVHSSRRPVLLVRQGR